MITVSVRKSEELFNSCQEFIYYTLAKILTNECLEYEDTVLAEYYQEIFDCDFLDIVSGFNLCNPEKTISLIKDEINRDIQNLFKIKEK